MMNLRISARSVLWSPANETVSSTSSTYRRYVLNYSSELFDMAGNCPGAVLYTTSVFITVSTHPQNDGYTIEI